MDKKRKVIIGAVGVLLVGAGFLGWLLYPQSADASEVVPDAPVPLCSDIVDYSTMDSCYLPDDTDIVLVDGKFVLVPIEGGGPELSTDEGVQQETAGLGESEVETQAEGDVEATVTAEPKGWFATKRDDIVMWWAKED